PEEPATRMTPELLWKLGRLSEASTSADGQTIAFTVRRYELSEDSGTTTLHLLNTKTKSKSKVIESWKTISSIQWAKIGDQEKVFFIGMSGKASEDETSDESDVEEAPQAWSFDPETGNTIQLTNIEGGIANLKVAPTGSHIAFTADIKMDNEVKDVYPDLPKADARIIDGLMYRHWNAWHDYKYSHLHIAKLTESGTEEPTDLMDGIRADCPVPPFGGAEQFNWSPNGKEIAYTLKDVDDWAESTNSDVFVISIDDQEVVNISKGMEGYDNNPVYSPDGKYLAFHSMKRAGFEADRNRIMIYNRETSYIRDLTQGLDQTAHDAQWTPDSKALIFASEYRGTNQLFRVEIDAPAVQQVSKGRFNWSNIQILPGGDQALVSQMSMLRPKELAILNLKDSTFEVVTHINDDIYENLELPKIEERWVDATDGKKIHCWVIHPPEFDANANQKWPMLTYCQGGPQGQIGQWFSYRWNFHLMAAQGYVVVAPNRRGLPGFGREWNDQISGDWGGQAMKDLLSATDDMIKEPYIDGKRVGAIGASFGGYTVYWMMGNHNNRFCTMIAHCGVFNLESMYGSTEELFFVN
ncbi:MAG: prolyl oligopeptidase family serine peptidase, partial [Planctomycetota bacterium]